MTKQKNAMANAHKAQVAIYGTPISASEYRVLRDYAEVHGVRLSGFKNYVGDIEVISECFSAYYSRIDNEIAYSFVTKCINEAHTLDLSMEGR